MSGSKAERREASQARILEAARELFAAEGVAGLSVRAIARRAGLPVMTLYGYFPGKMGIIRALWSEALAPLVEVLDAAEGSTADPAAQLRAVAQAFVRYWLNHPERYKVVFLIQDDREREDDKWFIEETDIVADLLRFARLIAAVRGVPAEDCVQEGEALVCTLIGIAHLLIGMPEYPWAKGETYVDLMLRAFTSR